MFQDRKWEYVPKTLIFAKDDNHTTQIVDMVKEVFGTEFESGVAPERFVQKITYTAEDSNCLIRDLRTEKDFRIAVTVTLVATGTDVMHTMATKPMTREHLQEFVDCYSSGHAARLSMRKRIPTADGADSPRLKSKPAKT